MENSKFKVGDIVFHINRCTKCEVCEIKEFSYIVKLLQPDFLGGMPLEMKYVYEHVLRHLTPLEELL